MLEDISSTPFLPYERTGLERPLESVRLLAPCLPSKVVAIGLNYADHVAELGWAPPAAPMFFFKPSTAVIGPGERIVPPPLCSQLDYEGELAVVIGAVAHAVEPGRWREVVLGYTCAVDATARDLQAQDSQWGRAKGFDTSCPLGPWIDTSVNPGGTRLRTRVNGVVVQDASTSSMVFSVGALVSFVSSYITLLPGDVLLTGTPAGVGSLSSGDRVEVEIEDIGTLSVGVR